MNTPDQILTDALDALSLPRDVLPRLAAYRTALLAINAELNLTATDDPSEFTLRHIVDSIAAYRYFSTAKTILDVGSGGGLPGIPLALLFPNTAVTLCESKAKKASALTSMVRTLSLVNVRVAHANVFELRERFDTITARAFGELSKIADILKRIGTPHARAVCYKGKRAAIDEEIAKLTGSLYTAAVDVLSVPLLSEERHIVVIKKRQKA